MSNFDNDVAAGSIFRKVVCERCGAVNYEKFLGFNGEGWNSYPSYEGAGFGAVVIVPYVQGCNRKEMVLCPDCARKLDKIISDFMEVQE